MLLALNTGALHSHSFVHPSSYGFTGNYLFIVVRVSITLGLFDLTVCSNEMVMLVQSIKHIPGFGELFSEKKNA